MSSLLSQVGFFINNTPDGQNILSSKKSPTMVNRIVFTLISIFLLIQDKAEGQTSYDQEIKTAADSLIKTLSPLQKRSALIAFNDTARIKWNNLPVGMRARAGISVGDMTEQ